MQAKHFLILPSLLLASTAMAQTVSEGEALDKALSFLSSQQRARGTQNAARLTLALKAAAQDETYYYVFNNAAGGFVIIGGDETAADVLGYCDKGSFDPDNLPDNFRWWLSTYEQSISRSIRARKANGEAQQRAPRRAKANLTNIEPMIKTQWDQSEPYNFLIPGNEGRNKLFLTGCEATAAAQIMKYYEWPQHGWHSKSYDNLRFPYTYDVDFASTTYDWDNMLDEYDYSEGDAVDHAVAELMYHVGVAINMNFGKGLSTTSTSYAAWGLNRYFGYAYTEVASRGSDDQAWEELVYGELAAGRPVLYSGQSDGSGHAFVVDGYKDGKFDINWGWSGDYNGYFALTGADALAPHGDGSGGAGDDAAYTEHQQIVVGLEPDRAYDGGLTMLSVSNNGKSYYSNDKGFQLSLEFENKSGQTLTFKSPQLNIYDGTTMLDYVALENISLTAGEKKTILVTSKYEECLKLPGEYTAKLVESSRPDDQLEVFDIAVCQELKIKYTLTDDEWGTLFLPYEAEVPDGFTAYTVTGVNANDALVLQKAGKLEMNKAYLIHGTPGSYRFGGPDTGEQGVYQNGLLHGVTKNVGEYAPKGSFLLQNQPAGLGFYKVKRDFNIKAKAYTAYLEVSRPSGAPIYIDTETGIQHVELDAAEKAEILNVLGQRCADSHGLRIKDGKLMFVK